MYKLTIPKEQLAALWALREYAGRGGIALQIRGAVAKYLEGQEKEIGCPVTDLAEAIDQHEAPEERERQEE